MCSTGVSASPGVRCALVTLPSRMIKAECFGSPFLRRSQTATFLPKQKPKIIIINKIKIHYDSAYNIFENRGDHPRELLRKAHIAKRALCALLFGVTWRKVHIGRTLVS